MSLTRSARRRLLVLALFPLVALMAPLLARERPKDATALERLATLVPFDPDATDLDARLQPPGADHYLGTDDLGRDVLARLLHGARVSVPVGFAAAALALAVGTLLGGAAGALGAGTDRPVLFVTGVVQAFPALVLVAAGAALAPPSAWTAALLIALTGWPEVARLVRAEALRLSRSPHVEAARAAGASRARVVFVHVLPGAVAPALAIVPYALGGAVLLEASLSFLGLGAPPPAASWGRALADARESLTSAWWCVVPPALALFLLVLSARKLGEALSESR
ncbi:MAG: ABC transporter permease [Holophagales bacterium]|nr:ABC transporter permease [Holophagales bacterium]